MLRLQKAGYIVSVIARRVPKASNAGDVRYFAADICEPAEVDRALRDIIKRGALRCVLFFQRFRGDGDQWTGETATTVTATARLIDNLVAAHKLKNCSIVVVNSIAGRLVAPSNANLGYHVAKAGLGQLVRYYAAALGPRGIRVNSVTPGYFLKAETKTKVLKDKKLIGLLREAIPLRRMGRAEDVVDLMEFLCTDRASFITGQDIVVDGGLNLQYPEGLVRAIAGRS